MFGLPRHRGIDAPDIESIPTEPRVRPLDAALDHILQMRRRITVDAWKVAYIRNLTLELQASRNLSREQRKLVAEILDVLHTEP